MPVLGISISKVNSNRNQAGIENRHDNDQKQVDAGFRYVQYCTLRIVLGNRAGRIDRQESRIG